MIINYNLNIIKIAKEEIMHKRHLSFITMAGRLTALVIVALLVLAPSVTRLPQTQAYGALNEVPVYIDGQPMSSDKSAILSEGRTLIPIRALSENLDADISWDNQNRAIDITRGARKVRLWADNRLYSLTVGGTTTYDVCDVAPFVTDGTTYVPLRLVGMALGIGVEWNQATSSVAVNTSSEPSESGFFTIQITGLPAGGTVTDAVSLSLSGTDGYLNKAEQVRYLFLDKSTGMGKIVAMSGPRESARWIPDLSMNGSGILAAIMCDSNGNFIAGTAKAVTLALSPKAALKGVSSGQSLSGSIDLSCDLNFMADGVIYELSYADGTVDRSDLTDPQGTYTYTPLYGRNGPAQIRVLGVSGEAEYPSSSVPVNVSMTVVSEDPYVSLKAIDTANLGKIPVSLSITRNFDVNTTQYWARNTSTNATILLGEKPWGDLSWFPGPDMAGTWDIYVKVITPSGQEYSSNTRTVTVPANPSIILSGVGPGQVITDTVSLSSIANVSLSSIDYIITNPNNGTQAVMGTAKSPAQAVEWTPSTVNSGERHLQAVAVTADGQTIMSEAVNVTIYLGKIYTSMPIVAKDKFIDLIKPMAIKTQKETGMSAALQMSQAILETGWGQSLPVDKYSGLMSYNLFGVKGTGTKGSVICGTWEEYYGTAYRIDDYFRAYYSISESWDDHNALLLTRERYIPYTQVMYNSTWGAYALRRCGYATDSAYPGKLINIIDLYGLDDLDLQGI